MKLRNRPLLAGSLDDAIYVPRPMLERALLDAVRDERNVLLVGERGSGKTTQIRKLEADLPDRDIRVVDGTLASTAQDLLRLISRALGHPPDPAGDSDGSDDPLLLLDALAALPRRRDAIIVIDGSPDSDAAYTLFGRMRDQLWQLPNSWIVTATPEEGGRMRTPPADAFWSLILDVPPLDRPEIDDLLARGLDDQELARIMAEPSLPLHTTPRRVVRWVYDVLDGVNPSSTADLQIRANMLGRQAIMALHAIEALGRPVSAGDPELLSYLGWTRPNAARWLARMEHAGILRSFTGATEGQGRPPKLYEPVRSR